MAISIPARSARPVRSVIPVFAGAALLALVLAATGCVPDEPMEELCRAENHCVRDDSGDVFCEDGFEWEDPSDETNFNCVEVIPPPSGLALLGWDSHTADKVDITVIFDGELNLTMPRDLAVNPAAPHELWVLSHGQAQGDSATIVLDHFGTEEQTAMRYDAFGNVHFLANPSALAFADDGFFATAHDEDRLTQGPVQFGGTPEDFMGPTLWTSDREIFDGGHGGHMDMLHNSPNAVGCAWETGNVYWIFDGWHQSITRYDFVSDHGPGGPDHSDGIIARYVEGEVGYRDGVSSHMEYVAETGLLYIADTANNRIAVLDTKTGERGGNTSPNYDGADQYRVDGATLTTLIDGTAVDGMEGPSGLEIQGGHLWVSDYDTGRIFAFDMEGNLVDWLDTGLGSGALSGMAFDAEGSLFFVNVRENRVLRLRALPEEAE